MPMAQIRGVALAYEILGSTGPWVALSPGGRRGREHVASLAGRIAAAGYRVLIHDRRNCGASDVMIAGEEPEFVIWADDLHALLEHVQALPAVVGGSSSGCRLSLLFALRHPQAVRALLLWRVTGGPFAAQRLAETYYGQFIAAARAGGMAAVCETEHFRERIASRPANRARLMAMDPARFIAVMTHWRAYFLADAERPVIGARAEDLQSIAVPACIVPGNDKTHPRAVGRTAQRLLPGSELHELMGADLDLDLGPIEDWDAKEPEMAAIFLDFLRRKGVGPGA